MKFPDLSQTTHHLKIMHQNMEHAYSVHKVTDIEQRLDSYIGSCTKFTDKCDYDNNHANHSHAPNKFRNCSVATFEGFKDIAKDRKRQSSKKQVSNETEEDEETEQDEDSEATNKTETNPSPVAKTSGERRRRLSRKVIPDMTEEGISSDNDFEIPVVKKKQKRTKPSTQEEGTSAIHQIGLSTKSTQQVPSLPLLSVKTITPAKKTRPSTSLTPSQITDSSSTPGSSKRGRGRPPGSKNLITQAKNIKAILAKKKILRRMRLQELSAQRHHSGEDDETETEHYLPDQESDEGMNTDCKM